MKSSAKRTAKGSLPTALLAHKTACPKPKGAFYAIAKLPIDNSDKFCQWLLEKFNYNNQTVMLAPATGFYSSEGSGEQEVRIAYVLEKKALKNALGIIL